MKDYGELLKALLWCIDEKAPISRCKNCKYDLGGCNSDCINSIIKNAADAINDLQRENADIETRIAVLAETFSQIEAEAKSMLETDKMLKAVNAELTAKVAQYKAENAKFSEALSHIDSIAIGFVEGGPHEDANEKACREMGRIYHISGKALRPLPKFEQEVRG